MASVHCSSNTKLSRNVSGTSLYFHFINKEKAINNLKVFEFLLLIAVLVMLS